jgi:Flp pilus assembly protein TadG
VNAWREDPRQRGQALVEFALVFPIIALVLFGMVDLSRAVFAYNTASNIARSAARVAIVNQDPTVTTLTCDTTDPGVSAAGCAQAAGNSLGTQASDVTVVYHSPADTASDTTTDCAPLAIGCLAVVTVHYQFTPITPIIAQLIGPISITSTTKVPVERVCSSGC